MKVTDKNIQVKTIILSKSEVLVALKNYIEDQRGNETNNNQMIVISDDVEIKINGDSAEVTTYYPERSRK